MKSQKIILTISLLIVLTLVFVSPALAAITNPVIGETLGGTADSAEAASEGATFVTYFISIWKTIITVGGITVLIFFIWGAFEWITSGGDKSKLESARNRITQAAIGLIILVSSFTILGFISKLFFGDTFNLLQMTFSSPGETSSFKPETIPGKPSVNNSFLDEIQKAVDKKNNIRY